MATESKPTAQEAETEEDKFYCSKEKFIKFLRFVKTTRGKQNTYLKGGRKQPDLRTAKAFEKKLDEMVDFYLDNQDKLHDCPFAND